MERRDGVAVCRCVRGAERGGDRTCLPYSRTTEPFSTTYDMGNAT